MAIIEPRPVAGPELPARFWAASLAAAIPLFVLGLFTGSSEWPSRVASSLMLAAASGLLFAIILGACFDRVRVATQTRELLRAQPIWATRERKACHTRAERRRMNQEAVGYDDTDGVAAHYIGAEVYEREYREAIERWEREKEAELRSRTLLAGTAPVLTAIGTLLTLSPERIHSSGVAELMWPVALAAIMAISVALESTLRSSSWIRLYYAWNDWAKQGSISVVPIEKAIEVRQPSMVAPLTFVATIPVTELPPLPIPKLPPPARSIPNIFHEGPKPRKPSDDERVGN